MTTTPNYLLDIPAPGSPAYRNTWGTMENEGRSLIDTALGGVFSLDVSGSGITILTSTPAAPDQSRYAHYIFTGALIGAATVLWPQNCGRMFSVINNTTGAFNLTIGANNGSGAVAGATITLPVGIPVSCYSDGTNVRARVPYEQIFTVTSPITASGVNQPSGAFGSNFAVSWPVQFPTMLTGISVQAGLAANGEFADARAVFPTVSGATIYVSSGQNAAGVPVVISVRGH